MGIEYCLFIMRLITAHICMADSYINVSKITTGKHYIVLNDLKQGK